MRLGGKGKPSELASALAVFCPSGTRGLVPCGTCCATDSNGTPWRERPCAAPAHGSCRHATGQAVEAAGQAAEVAGQTAEVPGSRPAAALLSSSWLARAALVSLARPLPTSREDGACPFNKCCSQLLPPTPPLELFVNANGRQRFHSASH